MQKRFEVTTQDAYNYLASKYFTDQQLCMVMELNGKVDIDALATAVRLTLDMEPVFGCCFIEGGGTPFWERRTDLEKIELCSAVDTDSPGEALDNFINEPIHADVDPLVHVGVFRGEEGNVVCVKVNHSACDAGGIKQYVSMLSDVYQALAANREVVVQPNLGRRDQTQLFERTKDAKSRAMKGFPTPTWTLPQKEGAERLHCFANVPIEKFLAIKEFAHSKNATVNDLLLTAMYRTLFGFNRTEAGKPMVIQVSIDLRRYLPNCKAEAICNLSGAIYFALERVQAEPFGKTLERVAKLMGTVKQNYPGVDSAAGLEYLSSQGFAAVEKYMASSAEMGRKYHVTFPLLSNFGALSMEAFGGLPIRKAYITTPICSPPGFLLGATTYKDNLTLSIGYCGKENTSQIKKFLDSYVAELQAGASDA